jgi:hypothetical protein
MLMGTLAPTYRFPPLFNQQSRPVDSALFTMSLLDRLSTPLFLLSDAKVVIWMNASCRRFFAESGEPMLQSDRFQAAAKSQRIALDAILQEGRERVPGRIVPGHFPPG